MDDAKRKWYADKLMIESYRLDKAKDKKEISLLVLSIIAVGKLLEKEDIGDEQGSKEV